MLGKAHTTAGRVQSTKAEGKQDPKSAAGSAKEQEYNRLALDEMIRTLEEKR
jgi:hypothetical protein